MDIQSASQKVLARIRGFGRGSVFTPKDFIDIACHVNVRKILSRLDDEQVIRRLLRGVYDYPIIHPERNAPADPDPDCLAQAIARAHAWRIFPTGQAALKLFGLTSESPASWEYFTDGPTGTYSWLGGKLVLRHRAHKETAGLSTKTALLVSALRTIGQDRVDEAVIDHLRSRMTEHERARAASEARYVTSWVYEIISRLAGSEALPLS